MTLYELQSIIADATDQRVHINNAANDFECIYQGYLSDIPWELEEEDVWSIDNVYGDIDYIDINVYIRTSGDEEE